MHVVRQVDGDAEVPLACQTAIVKRRHRRASAGVGLARYGSWAQHAELEAALREEDECEEGNADIADSDDGQTSDCPSESQVAAAAVSRRRASVLTTASNALPQSVAESTAAARSRRPARKSVAPAAQVRKWHGLHGRTVCLRMDVHPIAW